jgi:hypothetical protein
VLLEMNWEMLWVFWKQSFAAYDQFIEAVNV